MDQYDRPNWNNPSRPRRRARPAPEPLEGRRLMATFYVTRTGDDTEGGTLRAAILNANDNPGNDRIEFLLDTEDPGYVPASGSTPAFWSIRPRSALPTISPSPISPTIAPGPNAVAIDGTSQAGYQGRPIVEINGIDAGAGVDGLTVAVGGCVITGLAINQFQLQIIEGQRVGGSGIHLTGEGGNVIQANYLGPDVSANRRVGNGRAGLFIDNSPNNLVGGTLPGQGNILSSNRTDGVFIQGKAASGNVIQGNAIGTNFDFNPQADLANLIDGVEIDGAPGNLIGGEAAGAANVIARNNGNGVSIRRAGATGNAVQGNFIGTDRTGGLQLGNLLDGVFVSGASGNLIGGVTPGSRNIIGRNRVGVDIQPLTGEGLPVDATGNAVLGNLIGIGLDPLGNPTRLDNLTDGVNVGGSANVIGGPGAANVISRNGANGILIVGRDLGGGARFGGFNRVESNRIGTDPSGTVALPNAQNGLIVNAAQGTYVVGNQVSGNATAGVVVFGADAFDTFVEGNFIGTDAAGSAALGNGTEGVLLTDGAHDNRIGGAGTPQRNLISGNGVAGVRLARGATRNEVVDNQIGLDAGGKSPLGNGFYGVFVGEGATANRIGGDGFGTGNLISSNRIGVTITGPQTVGNLVQANLIGVLDGETQQTGVLIENAPNNVVGGALGNVIRLHSGSGVQVSGAGATGNVISRNRVLANGGNGVMLVGAGGNLVGGSGPGEGNRVSGNGGNGVAVQGAAAGNAIVGNLVGASADRGSTEGNVAFGVYIQDAPGTLVQGNLVVGNRTGIEVNGAASVRTVIRGNLIGTNDEGADLGNLTDGIALVDVVGAVVGGSAPEDRNVVAGNRLDGVHVIRGASTAIQGNYVGITPARNEAQPNRAAGIHLEGTSGAAVGGSGPGQGNVISGNGVSGVRVDGAGAVSPRVQGNRIGTDPSGSSRVPNLVGVLLDDVAGVVLEDNQISGNANFGVQIIGASSTGNHLVNNRIGLAADGSSPLANVVGVLVDGAPANVVGPGNVISGNAEVGVQFFGLGATGNSVIGNLIGTNVAGTRGVEVPGASGNQARLQDIGVIMNDAPGNLVGGTAPGSGNVISGNLVGVEVAGVNAGAPSGSGRTSNAIFGNRIGTDPSGTRAVGNVVGVYVNGVPGVRIGGPGAGEGNVISGNTSIGVSLFGRQTNGVTVEGNFVGTTSDGLSSFKKPNGQFVQQVGVFLEDTSSNRVGGSNVISGNAVAGVYIFGRPNASRSNLIQGNLIGLGSNGKKRVGNGAYGVLLFNSANNTVARSGRGRNRFGPAGIAAFREFTGPVGSAPGSVAAARARGVNGAGVRS